MRLPEAPVALYHGTAHVLPVHHDRNAAAARHNDHGSYIDPGSSRVIGASKDEP
jgi:hypothetical protein